jgi:phosphatidate cytidylyltransferase
VLATRLATAAALVAALLAALFYLPPPGLAALVAVLVALGGYEWARLCGRGTASAGLYATVVTGFFLILYYQRLFTPPFILAALFWAVVAPLWLWRGVSRRGLLEAGVLVLVPAGLAMLALRPLEIVLMIGLVSAADTAAYFV